MGPFDNPSLAKLVDLEKTSLYICILSMAFHPLLWNSLGRSEYHYKLWTKLFMGHTVTANYFVAAIIFSSGLFRDWLYKSALAEQPAHPLLLNTYSQAAGWTLIVMGNIFVVTSTVRLGIRATFLGDYFGYLLDEIVTGFPFNVVGAPMYWGSTMSFLGTSLVFGKPVGLFLTVWLFFLYNVALSYEDPFTAAIYAKRDRERAAVKAGKKQI